MPEDSRPAGLRQCADAVLMVRPAAFDFNCETEPSNRFQKRSSATAGTLERALAEFAALEQGLRDAGVATCAVADRPVPACPDAVFPNNWVSFHADGTVVLYPMLAASRRRERRMDLLLELEQRGGFEVARLLDLSHHEMSGRFLEGTGSVVFDHAGRIAYACLSPRTDVRVLDELCAELGYQPFAFAAEDAAGVPVYHTNVMLSIGSRCAVVCAEAVAAADRPMLMERLAGGGRTVVNIDQRQMASFAGNALELRARGGARVLVMSARALASLDGEARETLQRAVDRVIAVPVPTIEDVGGGSVRCMLAEVFLPRRAAMRAE
ncbi:MAG: arginine deiminase-related protein [Steroidobacteraceae bacterium]